MISRVFIDRPRFAGVISIVLMLAGILSIFSLPVAQYPDVTPPTVMVSAFYPGASAEVMADTVAGPIEDAVNGVDDMIYMSSTSDSAGNYTLTVSFKVGTDPDISLVKVQNRVAQAEPLLPTEVTQKGISVQTRSSDILGFLMMRSPDGSRDDLFLSDYAYKVIKPALERVPGVSSATVFGSKYGMRVWLDADRMSALGISSAEVVAAIRGQNVQASIGSVGSAPGDGAAQTMYTLKTTGRLNTPEEFRKIIVRTGADGAVVYLGDVARIEKGADTYLRTARYNGTPAVPMMLSRASSANALATMNAMRAELASLQKQFPSGVACTFPYDATKFVRVCIEEIGLTLLLTFLLVVGVCYIFLQDWRATLIPALTIPVSLCATFAVLKLFGYSINTLTLFGLVLAIGLVVDDAIVVVERVLYLMENEGLDQRAATIKAMEQVTSAIIATTLVLLAIFVPIGFMGGIVGKIYQQFALSISAAVVFSSVNALTLSPALCATILRVAAPRRHGPLRWFNAALAFTRTGYVYVAGRLARRLLLTVVLLAAVGGGAAWIKSKSPTAFLPDEDQGIVFGAVQLPEGATLARTDDLLAKALAPLEKEPGVAFVIQITGFSLIGGGGENIGFFVCGLDDWSTRTAPGLKIESILQKLRGRLAAVPGAQINLFMPPAIRGLGASSGMSIRLQAVDDTDPHKLEAVLQGFLMRLNTDPAIMYAFSTYTANTPYQFLDVDRAKAALMDVDTSAIFEALQDNLGSRYVNNVNFEGQVNNVDVQADWPFRNEVSDIARLYVKGNRGNMVPLGSLVKPRVILAPRAVDRYNKFASAAITAIAAPMVSSGDAIKEVAKIAGECLPPGYAYDWTDLSYQEAKASGGGSALLVAMALLFGYLFLVAQYESWIIPLPVILSTAVASLGALAGLLLLRMPLSIYAQLGLILLIGLASKNAILIVEFSRARHEEGLSIVEAAEDGTKQRFRAVLMTAFTFILGVLPMVRATGAGSAARRSIGATVFWGMLAATVFGIILIPALYALFQTWREKGGRARGGHLSALLILLAVFPLLGGCGSLPSVGPDYHAPQTPAVGAATNQVDAGEWWKRFDDPEMTALVDAAQQNNNDLKSAIAAVRAARAQLGVARGGYGPEIDASGSVTRYKASENAFSFNGGKIQTLYNAGFDASWEIDLFGGTRRSVEAAVADWQARQANLGDVRISIAAETAGAYLGLRTQQRLLAVARSTVAAQEATLELLESRRAAGLGNELAVQQARYNLEAVRATVPPIDAAIEADRNALAVLVGRLPGDLDCAGGETIPAAKIPLEGIPADVLRRRPDVRRAERQLAARTARIGESKADLYPRFSLVGSIGLESLSSSTWIEGNSRRYSVAPGVSWPIFHSGSIRSNIKVQEALQEQALAAYESAVLNAVREVRDNLSGCRNETLRRDALVRAVAAARSAEEVALDLYKNGLTDFGNVLDAQRSLYLQQVQLAVSEGQIGTDIVALYKALGGGWEPMEESNDLSKAR